MSLKTISLVLIFIFSISNFSYGQSSKYHKNKLIGKTVCDISKDVSANLDFILKNAKSITKISEENCLLSLIDSLETLSIRAYNDKAFIALDSLSKYSDGYIADCLNDDIPKNFYTNFDGLINYLYNNPQNYLRELLIDGLSLEVSMTEDRVKKMDEIKSFKDKKLEENKYSQIQRTYINRIIKDIKPEKWD